MLNPIDTHWRKWKTEPSHPLPEPSQDTGLDIVTPGVRLQQNNYKCSQHTSKVLINTSGLSEKT